MERARVIRESSGQDRRKTAQPSERVRGAEFERRPDGSIVIRSLALAQQVLRGDRTEQAGFNADLVRRLPFRNKSVLFSDGAAHRRQRAAAAHLFAPSVVSGRYLDTMRRLSRALVDGQRPAGRFLLEDITLALTAGVAAEIIGLTQSRRPGLERRLSDIFQMQSRPGRRGWLASLRYVIGAQVALARIYLLDLRPALRARRGARNSSGARNRHGADLITALQALGWSQLDILIECISYGTAAVSTTREFIAVALLHLMDDAALRTRFQGGDHEERLRILGEILRLEPPVSTLLRRTTAPLALKDRDTVEPVAAGCLVAIDIRAVNADPAGAGRCPHAVLPDRKARGPAGLMSFGDGAHRCPGTAVALNEAAILLDDLLRLPNLRVVSGPSIGRDSTSTGYILRDLVLASE